ncbi:hypothetical protein MT355_18985 [Rathayibacter sp. VKM Ac-2929]|uniref:hypothetical protein n=1 Tax=Rathayibacter sp. VKM Ac-2929 TaxID=2929480 RepID=UPI001FB206BE|nr:hypothetical protein [Rathayibacter sp. VKM Ac-2929]MCJ1675353.1 hypothetical protein [Rathayibacter sp. VKM Ac-2929]
MSTPTDRGPGSDSTGPDRSDRFRSEPSGADHDATTRFDTTSTASTATGATGATATTAPDDQPAAHRAPVDPDSAEAAKARTAARKDIHQREKDRFGGLKIGCAFFGWLAATGLAVILTALVTAIGAAVVGTQDVTADLAADPAAFGWVGAIALLVILLVAYYSGGYVAGRMARFSGAKQGVAVWAWAVVVAIVVGIVSALTGGSQILSAVSGFPQIPLDAGDATVTAIVTVLAALVVSLVGAVLGGLAGMRFHRRVDREGLSGLAV